MRYGPHYLLTNTYGFSIIMAVYKKIISPIDLKQTKGQMEDVLSKAFVQFYVQKLGVGPKKARAYIVEDMIIARLWGRLHPLENFLLKDQKGIELVKDIRKKFQEATFQELNTIIKSITGYNVTSYHSDTSTRTGERFEIFILDHNLGDQFENE